MKRVLSFYYVPAVIFLLLSFANMKEPSVRMIVMTILSSLLLGLFAGFVFHLAMIVRNKLTK